MNLLDEKSISIAKQDFPNIVRQAAKGHEVITSNFKTYGSSRVSIISGVLILPGTAKQQATQMGFKDIEDVMIS